LLSSAQCQWQGAEEHGVHDDGIDRLLGQDGPQVAVLPGDGADEDATQIVLHPAHATLGRRLAFGVRHHEVVRVVLRCEGDERRARRGDPVAVVRRGEEDHVVALGDQPARQCEQGDGVALGRRGAQHVAPPKWSCRTQARGLRRRHVPTSPSLLVVGDLPGQQARDPAALGVPAPPAGLAAHASTTAPLHGPTQRVPSTTDPSSAPSVATATRPRTSPNSAGASAMFNSTTVALPRA